MTGSESHLADEFDWDGADVLRHECVKLSHIHAQLVGHKQKKPIPPANLVIDALKPYAEENTKIPDAGMVADALSHHTRVMTNSMINAMDQSAVRIFTQICTMTEVVELLSEAQWTKLIHAYMAQTEQAITDMRNKLTLMRRVYEIPFLGQDAKKAWSQCMMDAMKLTEEFADLKDKVSDRIAKSSEFSIKDRSQSLANAFNDLAQTMVVEIQAGNHLAEDCLRMAGTIKLLSWKKDNGIMTVAVAKLMDLGHEIIVQGDLALDECTDLRRKTYRMVELQKPLF